ncbi:MAG TPA: class I SAM-dependent methyltransferase [Anaerolineales bacterium]|nr:class I SAM-dependent methyltransferase [Anaerolineales bacterium]
MSRPESIENRWDILYRDYPEVYEAFSNTPYHPTVYEQLPGIIDLRGKCIADVGAGTGSSSLALARSARHVIGIEREAAMLRRAREKARGANAQQVTFLSGDALALPLADDSVDLVTGITLALFPPEQYRDFIREGLRVAKGPVVYLGISPGWYGGDLCEVIEDVEKVDAEVDHIFIEEFQFAYQDIFSNQEYGTVENIVSTYGFIFGKKAIEYLKRENQTAIRWKFRVYWRE